MNRAFNGVTATGNGMLSGDTRPMIWGASNTTLIRKNARSHMGMGRTSSPAGMSGCSSGTAGLSKATGKSSTGLPRGCDPEHPNRGVTASLITQQDLGGDYSTHINDVELRNAPDTTSWRRGTGLAVFAITGAVFSSRPSAISRQPSEGPADC
jgi:hypothetical protein